MCYFFFLISLSMLLKILSKTYRIKRYFQILGGWLLDRECWKNVSLVSIVRGGGGVRGWACHWPVKTLKMIGNEVILIDQLIDSATNHGSIARPIATPRPSPLSSPSLRRESTHRPRSKGAQWGKQIVRAAD